MEFSFIECLSGPLTHSLPLVCKRFNGFENPADFPGTRLTPRTPLPGGGWGKQVNYSLRSRSLLKSAEARDAPT